MSTLHTLITLVLLSSVVWMLRRIRMLESNVAQLQQRYTDGANGQVQSSLVEPAVQQKVQEPLPRQKVQTALGPTRSPANIGQTEEISASVVAPLPRPTTQATKNMPRWQRAATASFLVEIDAPESPNAPPAESHHDDNESIQIPKTSWADSPLLGWFLRSHVLVQIGMLILFIGIAFLLKLVADQGMLSIELRHVAAAAGGVLMSGFGLYLRKRARTYALALQGGGLGIIYLTSFFAYRIYGLIPPMLAFGLFVVLGVGCAALAVLNNARILAFLAIAGAFLAPILASDGGGSHVALFSYYAVVNAAILAIAWFKAWRSLNLAGFLFTVAAAVAWGSSSYESSLFNSTEPFLILFFFFYVAIALLFSLRGAPHGEIGRIIGSSTPIDILLLFGNPLAALSMQVVLVQHIDKGLAWSTLIAGLFYAVLAMIFLRIRKKRRPLLTESLLFLGFLFLTMCVPFFFDAQVTSATWAISGAASVWLGTRRRQIWSVLWGIFVQAIATVFFGIHLWENDIVLAPPFANALFVGAMLLALAGLFSGYLLRKPHDSSPEAIKLGTLFFSLILSVWGMLWWFGSTIAQLIDFASEESAIMAILAFTALSAALGEFLGLRLKWWAVRIPAVLLISVMALLAFVQFFVVEQPFAGRGFLAWPLAFAVHYWALNNRALNNRRHTQQPLAKKQSILDDVRLFSLHHAGGLWLLTLILTWFAAWQVDQLTSINNMVTTTIIAAPSLIILLLSQLVDALPWPIRQHRQLYLTLGLGPIIAVVLFWTLGINLTNSGDAAPMVYVPLLNPLGIAQILLFGGLFIWRRRVQPEGSIVFNWMWGLALFAAINLSIARAVHQLGGVAYSFDALYSSDQLQTIYAIFWGALSLALVFIANRRQMQPLWVAGIMLLGVTVLKLFIVDLANTGSIARIVSFIGVGLLTIAIAYFAPAPTSTEDPSENQEEVLREVSEEMSV